LSQGRKPAQIGRSDVEAEASTYLKSNPKSNNLGSKSKGNSFEEYSKAE
jgi:hypothetical protein